MMKKFTDQFLCSRMMLPEHVEALSRYNKKNLKEEDTRISSVDEQELENWERLIKQSLEHRMKITVTYLAKDKKKKSVIGAVTKVDVYSGMIFIAGKGGKVEVDLKKIFCVAE